MENNSNVNAQDLKTVLSNKAGIRAFFQAIAAKEAHEITRLETKAAYKGLQALYGRQTIDEQAIGATRKRNGRGFSGADSEFLSSVALSSQRYESLTPKQAKFVAKRLARYAGQLEEVAQANILGASVAQEVA